MARRPRNSWAGGTFHVMNRGVNRQPIFFGDADRVEFGRLLGETHERFGVEVIAYCLMTNHYHLVVRLGPDRLSAAMQYLGGAFARGVNDRIGRDGPLFRGRFLSLPITTNRYLHWAVRYVHRNALDLPGVTSVEQHRWSSMRTYLELRPAPPFMDLGLIRAVWDDPAEFLAFHASPEAGRFPIGRADDFAALVEHHVAIDALHRPDEIGGRAMQWMVRSAKVLVADRVGDERVTSWVIDEYPSPNAWYSARSRARARLLSDPRLGAIVDGVVGSLPRDLAVCA